EMNSKIDVRSVLDTVRVPTLIVHREGDPQVTVENGRYLAEHIADARLVELPGADHLPWIDADDVLAPVEAFVAELAAAEQPVVFDGALATTLFTDIDGSTDLNATLGDARWSALLDRHDEVMREVVGAWQGRVVKSTGDGVLAIFDMPARAIRAALVAQ